MKKKILTALFLICAIGVYAFASGGEFSGVDAAISNSDTSGRKFLAIGVKWFLGLLAIVLGFVGGFKTRAYALKQAGQNNEDPLKANLAGVGGFIACFFGSIVIIAVFGGALSGDSSNAITAMQNFWKEILTSY